MDAQELKWALALLCRLVHVSKEETKKEKGLWICKEALPVLHRDFLHSPLEPLWKSRTGIMFECFAGPMGERRAPSHKQTHSPHSVASNKNMRVKNINEIKLTG